MKNLKAHLVITFAITSVVASVALLLIRSFNSLSFDEPLQLTTSGAEYESLFAFWKYVHGEIVYSDHFKIPFAGTFYNWLYYVFYGEIIKASLDIFALNDAWLPTIARLVTLAGALYGTFISSLCCFELLPTKDRNLRILCITFPAILFLGPLTGFFAIAAQPDVWGVALDVTAIFAFLRYYPRNRALAVVLFSIFALAAWSFKQIFVYTSGSVGTYLLLRRDWKHLTLLVVLIWGGWGSILLLGTKQYIFNIVQFGGVSVVPSISALVTNLINVAPKILPIALGLASVIAVCTVSNSRGPFLSRLWPRIVSQTKTPALPFLAVAAIVTGAIAIPASAKLGAAENYYFLFFVILAMLLLHVIAEETIHNPAIRNWTDPVIGAGLLLHTLATAAALIGIVGVLSPKPMYQELLRAQRCLLSTDMRQPVFIQQPYLSLPWMYPADLHFVVQTNYRWDRASGVPMEGGGIGGLIDSGYFGSLAISSLLPEFDGSNLSKYVAGEKCGPFRVYRRKSTDERK